MFNILFFFSVATPNILLPVARDQKMVKLCATRKNLRIAKVADYVLYLQRVGHVAAVRITVISMLVVRGTFALMV